MISYICKKNDQVTIYTYLHAVTYIYDILQSLPLHMGNGPLQNEGFPSMHLIVISPMSS